MKNQKRLSLLQLRTSLWVKVVATAAIMLALIALVYLLGIPNPNMILIAGLVLCSALFGFGGGIVAAVIMLIYTLYFFSTDHNFVSFTDENLLKVLVSLVGIAADMVFVCLVKESEMRAFDEVSNLSDELHRENEHLQSISFIDGLTGVRNRTALRVDFNSYLGRPVTVLMLDLNNFKTINDTLGHEEGDRVLKRTARLLSDAFGAEHCYRYGGDEFLVIYPDTSESTFAEKLDALARAHQADGLVDADGALTDYSFSVGYVRATPQDSDDLHELVSRADERMYQAKRDRSRARETRAEEKTQTSAEPHALAPTKAKEFTIYEMQAYLQRMEGDYDRARVVDPIECRILEFDDDGKVRLSERCHGIWNSGQRCINCSSAKACMTGQVQTKEECLDDHVYHIESDPIMLRLTDGASYDAVVELVQVDRAGSSNNANDRAAENVGARAAHYHAYHDSLTSVLTASAFYEFARELVEGSPHASWTMVTSDVKSFHLINTLFGVLMGNEVLVRVASLLQRVADDADGLCGRLGGDQFALLLPTARYEERELERMAQSLSQEFSSNAFVLCCHFGVYHVEDVDLPTSIMCGRANTALHTIHESLTASIAYFDDAMRRRMLFEHAIISGFDGALRSGELQMYLQPLVCGDGTVVGAEALARWCKSDGGMIMPGDFVEVLERVGMIHMLDIHIWELAVQQLSAWKGTSKGELTISINMSAKDFYNIDVYEVLTGLVDAYGVESRMLRLEITESALLVEPEKGDNIVARLRNRGFVVEIDDFGKGYSSLSLLKNIQADILKIDMGFLHEIGDHKRSRIILQSVIDMAQSLGMDVITEGVETEQQLRDLLSMGCQHFQGYYFSRPIPVEEFEQFCSQ